MDESSSDKESLYARIQELEHGTLLIILRQSQTLFILLIFHV